VDVLKKIIIKLQKRVQAGAATLLVKVKTHRGDPLNEEADIRSELGLRKEQEKVRWNNPTNRPQVTVYQWTVGRNTRSTTWTNTVRNRFRQKSGEIEVFQILEIGKGKWCRNTSHVKETILTTSRRRESHYGTVVGQTKLYMGVSYLKTERQNKY